MKQIDLLTDKISKTSSELEVIVYTKGIDLLTEGVNPDKVTHWINTVISSFNSMPKPLTDKQKLVIENKKSEKLLKKEKKRLELDKARNDMKELLDTNGIVVIGFFDYKEVSDDTYNLFQELSTKGGYFFNDFGDGALEPFVSKKEIGREFYNRYNELRWLLEDLGCDVSSIVTSSSVTSSTSDFIKRII